MMINLAHGIADFKSYCLILATAGVVCGGLVGGTKRRIYFLIVTSISLCSTGAQLARATAAYLLQKGNDFRIFWRKLPSVDSSSQE